LSGFSVNNSDSRHIDHIVYIEFFCECMFCGDADLLACSPYRPTVLPPSRPQVTGSESLPVARRPMDFRVPIGSRQNGESGCAEFPVFPLMPEWDCKTQRNLSGQNESSGATE
jgi:hypothetical protein